MRDLHRHALGMILVGALLLPQAAFAQLNFSVSPTPVGSGARAAGMSDAFVAIADDATAASWNPAGLIQLEEPEFSFVYDYSRASEDLSARDRAINNSAFNDNFKSTSDAANFASFVYPAYLWNRNVSFSIAYRNGYDFSKSYDLFADSTGAAAERSLKAEFDQAGSLGTITPAFAVSLTNTLSVGVSLNLWRSNIVSDNDWKIDQRQVARVYRSGDLLAKQEVTQVENFENFSGENYVIGVLWNATDKWNVGLRYDSAFTGEVDYSRVTRARLLAFGGPTPLEFRQSDRAKEGWRVKFPWTVAIGTAYRFTDRFTLSADVSVSDWGESYVKDGSGQRYSIIDGLPTNDPGYTHAKRNMVARLGGEYVFIPRELSENLDYLWSLRGGLVYEEEPATGKPTGFGNGKEGDGEPESFYGASVGVGLLAKQRFNFDFAYQFRYGDSVNKDFVTGPKNFEQDTRQHRFILSTVVYF